MSADIDRKPVSPVTMIACFALLAGSAVWIASDATVWPWDQAWYGEVTVDLARLRHGSVLEWLTACLTAFGSKPPLLSWIAQFFTPLARVFGDIEPALLTVNLVTAAATMFIIARISARMGSGAFAQLAAVLVFGSSSLAMGLWHQFLTEPLQMLSVAILMDIAWKSERRARSATILWLVFGLSITMLIKSSSFTFAVPLVTYCLVAALIRRQPNQTTASPVRSTLLFVAALGSLAACVGWYWVNWQPMTQHFRDATLSDIALAYGSIGSLGEKLRYWFQAMALALSPWPALAIGLAALSLIAFLTAFLRLLSAPAREWLSVSVDSGFLFTCALAGTILVTIIGLATQINEETRFLSPLLPICGVLTAWSLTVLRSRLLAGAIILAAAFNASVGMAFALGANPLQIQPSVWLKPMNTDSGPKHLLADAVKDSCSADRPNRYTVIGVEYPTFNANSAAFFSEKQRIRRGYRCYYTSLGYAETDLDKALARLDALDADYLVTFAPERQASADLFNRVSKTVPERLLTDKRFTAGIDRDTGIEIFRRQR